MTTKVFRVVGMHCSSCALRNEMLIGGLEGVEKVRVDVGKEEATITFDPAVVDEAQLAGAVAGEGYILASK